MMGGVAKSTANLTVSVPISLMRDVDELAAEDGRNRSNWVTQALTQAVRAARETTPGAAATAPGV